jgi:hypothetical protein
MKFDAIDRGERRFKWHGTAGTFVQYLTTATLALGVLHVSLNSVVAWLLKNCSILLQVMGRSLDVAFSYCILFAVACVFVSWLCLMRENPIWCRPPLHRRPPCTAAHVSSQCAPQVQQHRHTPRSRLKHVQ